MNQQIEHTNGAPAMPAVPNGKQREERPMPTAELVPVSVKLSANVLEQVLLGGDLSHLSPDDRLNYYRAVCESLGLNPLTKPFDYLQLEDKQTGTSKLVLYAKRDCTDQLRKIHDVSVKITGRELVDGIYTVNAQARMPTGREDEAIGAVPLVKEGGEWKTSQNGKKYFQSNGTFSPLSPDARANGIMKAECVPLNSAILTRAGWRRYFEVSAGDEVLAYDCTTDTCKWTPLEAVTVHESLPMARLYSDRGQFEVYCTHDHSWAVAKKQYAPKSTDGTRGPRGPYQSRKPDRRLVEACEIKSSDHIILSAPELNAQEGVLTPVEAAILGWAVTDGTIQMRGTYRRVGICQSKEENFPAIRELVAPYGTREITSPAIARTFPSTGRTYETKEQHWWYLPANVARDLLEKAGFEGRSDLPNLVARLSSLARRAMLQAMMLAEGDKRGVFANTDRHILDAFQLLCALEGVATGHEKHKSDGCYTIRKKLTRHVAGSFLNRESVGFMPAWCPTTAYGTWVMRQNGRVMITGNTKAKRRVTLSICGLGLIDESEIETIQDAAVYREPESPTATTKAKAITDAPTGELKSPVPRPWWTRGEMKAMFAQAQEAFSCLNRGSEYAAILQDFGVDHPTKFASAEKAAECYRAMQDRLREAESETA